MKRYTAFSLRLFGCALASSLVLAPACAVARDSGPRYRVEVLVFRHSGAEPAPATVDLLRPFLHAVDLLPAGPDQQTLASQVAPTEMPVRLPEDGDFLNQTWSRLSRLAGYEPLVKLTWEQSQVDYHPPVRVHDAEVIIEELHFPAPLVWLDLDSEDPFASYLVPLYRLDGALQLRRSRFLHLDLDLEYRIDDPAWRYAAPLPPAPGTVAGEPPAGSAVIEPETRLNEGQAPSDVTPEPFRVHRLRESRQVRSNEVHYFDSAYLGVLARVTSIADP